MEQLRQVDGPEGTIRYWLTRKRVRNLNLRLDSGGEIHVSIPWNCPLEQADRLVRDKWPWLRRGLERRQAPPPELLPELSRPDCLARLRQSLDRVYPLTEPLGVAYPQLKIRAMRSQWGNCHWMQGYITLNTALVRCPPLLRDYVALHELVHFLHHDHGPGFYAVMDALMPQWRQLRQELKRYAVVLR